MIPRTLTARLKDAAAQLPVVTSAVAAALVYGGKESHARRTIPVYAWSDIELLCRRIAG